MRMTIAFPKLLSDVDSVACEPAIVEKMWIKQRYPTLFQRNQRAWHVRSFLWPDKRGNADHGLRAGFGNVAPAVSSVRIIPVSVATQTC